MSFISDIFSGGAKGLLDGVTNILDKFIASPDEKAKAVQALTEATNSHIEKMAELAQKSVDSELNAKQAALDSAVKDTIAARDMNAKLQGDKASWMAKNIAYLIDSFVTVIWGGLTFYIILHILQLVSTTESVDFTAVMGIYAAVTAAFTTILSFHRGSSVGAKTKDDTINTMARNQ
tara:strand:+ start:371 stop:901 length:531 start_codon:yes stop_codon:yes gene_type:complete